MYIRPSTELPSGFDSRVRPWYIGGKEKGDVYWTNVYIDATIRNPIVTVAVPVYVDGRLILVLLV